MIWATNDKTNKITYAPSEDESSLSAWRNIGSSATQ